MPQPNRDRSPHQESVAYLTAAVIQSILVWLGFVRLHEPGRNERLMLVTDELRRVTRAEVDDRPAARRDAGYRGGGRPRRST